LEIAWFLGVFEINKASEISKFTKIPQAAVAASDIWGVLKYHEQVFIPDTPKKQQGKKSHTLRSWRNFYM